MNKNEFLDSLRDKLTGEISQQEVSENIRYYDAYITEALQNGKSEEEVFLDLGSPLLLAKTIIETSSFQKDAEKGAFEENAAYRTQERYQEGSAGRKKGLHLEYDGENLGVYFGRLKLNTWYGKLACVIAAVLLIYIVFSIVGSIVAAVAPIVLPILIIYIIFRIINNRDRRH